MKTPSTAALPTEGDPVEACHHMESVLRRAAAGTAGPAARLLVRVHLLSCAGCRGHLAALHEDREGA